MGILRKFGGIALILLSFLILLIFIGSFYDVIFLGGKIAPESALQIFILSGLMVYFFKKGLKYIKDKKVKNKTKSTKIYAFLGISLFFLGISVLLALIKIMIITSGGIYFKIVLIIPFIFLIFGIYWTSDALKNGYFNKEFFNKRIIFFSNDFKKSFWSAFGYFLGIIFLLYFAFAPLIMNVASNPVGKIIDFTITLNIVFNSAWLVFFLYGDI